LPGGHQDDHAETHPPSPPAPPELTTSTTEPELPGGHQGHHAGTHPPSPPAPPELTTSTAEPELPGGHQGHHAGTHPPFPPRPLRPRPQQNRSCQTGARAEEGGFEAAPPLRLARCGQALVVRAVNRRTSSHRPANPTSP
jgi:hypothetical protein